MKALIRKIFEKASFHGFPYIVRKDIHWIERTLWGIILLFASYFSISICWNQWERYKENPTVFGVERILGTREFPYVGVTMCSNYFDEQQAEIIINNTWKLGNNSSEYYMKFLQTLSAVRYDNLEILEPYENDASVDIDFLKTLWEIRSTLTSKNAAKRGGGVIEYGTNIVKTDVNVKPQFKSVITEVGMCLTTSFLHEYQNPRGFQREPEKVKFEEMCSPFDVCNLKVAPTLNDGNKLIAYIHNNKDMVPHDDNEVILREMKENEITGVDIDVDVMTAEKEVRYVPVKYRKCRFTDENNFKYFKIYRPGLCRNECRINAALRQCKCKPFFYIVGPGPICTVKGMQCLARANWKDTKCKHCVNLCSVVKYTALKAAARDYGSTKFERSLLINLSLPKLGIRRRVVFSTDQLVVAFGGAASLFLGCSFLSLAQTIYYCIQSLEEKFKRCWGRFKIN